MKYPHLLLLFPSAFLLLFSGCAKTQPSCTQKEIQSVQTQLTLLQSSLQKIESKKEPQIDESFKNLSLEQKEHYLSLHKELAALRLDQNVTQALLKERQKVIHTKPIVVYKNKKEISKFKDKLMLGREENVFIEPSNILMRARIDTGAQTSSLDARNVEEFERDGKKWVRFTLIDRRTNVSHILEKRVVRRADIVQSSLEGKYDTRVVVRLKIKVGDFSDFSEFTLTNRDHMDFPILIGRSFLKDIAIVDVSSRDLAPIKKGAKK